MQSSIPAKPTMYKGILFRSKLEARWAAFFDALPVVWEYEPRWFNLKSGNYLPDFRVVYPYRDTVRWFEVKPNLHSVEREQWQKYVAFPDQLLMLDGPPDEVRMYNEPWRYMSTLTDDPYVKYFADAGRMGTVLWSRRRQYQGTYWGWQTQQEYFQAVADKTDSGYPELRAAIRHSRQTFK
jgi:hypothetical protein